MIRPLSTIGALAGAALLIASCGTDPQAKNSGQSSSSADVSGVVCGGKGKLSAEGSSAQKAAMDIFIQQYQNKCSGP